METTSADYTPTNCIVYYGTFPFQAALAYVVRCKCFTSFNFNIS